MDRETQKTICNCAYVITIKNKGGYNTLVFSTVEEAFAEWDKLQADKEDNRPMFLTNYGLYLEERV